MVHIGVRLKGNEGTIIYEQAAEEGGKEGEEEL